MWLWILLATAFAADGPAGAWYGTWSLDPVRSDDPRPLVEQAVRGPLLNATGARQMAPDGGTGIDPDEQRRVMLNSVLGLLARSGQFTLGEPSSEQDVTLTYAGDTPIGLVLGRKWVRTRSTRGVVRVRARLKDQLVVERREKTVRVTETLLPPDDDGLLAVVVRVDGSGIHPLEFRRIYRNLDEDPAD